MWRLFALLALLAAPVAAHEDIYAAEIEGWYDGDTPTVSIELGLGFVLKSQALRLMCIDTPEVRGSSRSEGIRVRDRVRRMVPVGSSVNVKILGRGKFGRWLAFVFTEGSEESVNRMLLDDGDATLEAYSARDAAMCRAMR